MDDIKVITSIYLPKTVLDKLRLRATCNDTSVSREILDSLMIASPELFVPPQTSDDGSPA